MSSSSRIATDLPEPDIPETTTRRIKLGGEDHVGPSPPAPPQGKRGASACIGPHGGPSPPAPLPKGRGERQLASGLTGAPHPRPLSPRRRREEGQVSVHQASPPMRQRREAAVVGSASALGWTLQALRH